jgi:hypothetical protein
LGFGLLAADAGREKERGVKRRCILAGVQTRREYCRRHLDLQRHHHGRMRATLAKVPEKIPEGHELDDKTAKTVPPAMIDRVRSRKAARAFLPKRRRQYCFS